MKVFITTSGTGSRLGELTKHFNKALVRIGKKPAISYIIEMYPRQTEFVITLGYKGQQVKDFLTLAYPKRKFTFVTIDKYEGPGTSLGYSMLRAKSKLQSPFIFHACDTIVEGFKVPNLKHNWATGIHLKDTEQYTSFDVNKKSIITQFNPKGAKKCDYVHIGLIGIKDYKDFWKTLEKIYKQNPNNSSLNDTITLSDMIARGAQVRGVPVKTWLDIGNPPALAHARAHIKDRFDNPDKVDEALYFFEDFVIKFFADPKKVADRVKRGQLLGKLVPKTLAKKKNFYKYGYVKGDTYSDVATATDFKHFLNWSHEHLWKPVSHLSEKAFSVVTRDFYETKTRERIRKFLEMYEIPDEASIINGQKISTIKDLLDDIDFGWISRGIQTKFHGDYILENILKTRQGYSLLDWRQDFGGNLKSGDMYYDLAKLYHNLVVNHDQINKDKFKVEIVGDTITCTIDRKKHLIKCEQVFELHVVEKGLDLKKLKALRALIWLNMAPLHHQSFGLFLYYYGKFNLWNIIKSL